jgi:hypothetical protein
MVSQVTSSDASAQVSKWGRCPSSRGRAEDDDYGSPTVPFSRISAADLQDEERTEAWWKERSRASRI